MTQKTRTKSTSQTGTASLEFDDIELQATMQNFLSEEEKKEDGKGIWNFATIFGMFMLFTGLSFVLQWIGLPLGDGMENFLEGAISSLPLIGGALVTLVGLGFFVGDRRRVRREERKRRKDFKTKQKASKKKMDDVHGSENVFSSTFNNLRNDLDSDKTKTSSKTSSYTAFDTYASGNYGYRPAKKLMKSRSDKKWAGVCGGLAKYFGISSTVVRFIFVAAFFMGYGASFLIYLGLSLAMPKEPVELMDDFDF